MIDKNLKVFHIETTLNNRMFGAPLEFLAKKEEDFTEGDRLKFQATLFALKHTPRAAARKIFNAMPAPYEVTACSPARPSRPTRRRWRELEAVRGAGRGPERHRHLPHPVHLAVQRQLASSTRCSCR